MKTFSESRQLWCKSMMFSAFDLFQDCLQHNLPASNLEKGKTLVNKHFCLQLHRLLEEQKKIDAHQNRIAMLSGAKIFWHEMRRSFFLSENSSFIHDLYWCNNFRYSFSPEPRWSQQVFAFFRGRFPMQALVWKQVSVETNMAEICASDKAESREINRQ